MHAITFFSLAMRLQIFCYLFIYLFFVNRKYKIFLPRFENLELS